MLIAFAPGDIVAHVSAPATSFGLVEFGDETGANVIEHDGDIAWFEKEDIVKLDAEKLHFRIYRLREASPAFAPWFVEGNREDWAGDLLWGNFLTQPEAVNFATASNPALVKAT